MKTSRLEEICEISIGRTPSRNSKEYWGSGYKWVSISDMKSEVITQTKEEITEKAVSSLNCKKIPAGTLLMSFKLSIGKLAFAGTELYTNEAIASLIIRDETILNNKFLFFALKQMKFSGGNQAVMGVTLNSKSLASIQIPLPPLPEQIAIANILSKAEALIAKRKESLALLDAYLKSTFLEMFGDEEAKRENWPVVKIHELAADHKGSMRTGPFGSNLLHSEFSEEGEVAVLGIDNAVKNKFAWGAKRFISKQKYEELKAYRIYPGDVIITIMGTVGRSAVIPDDIPLAINTKHLAALTFDKKKANPKFICFSFQTNPSILNQIQSKNRGAIMDGLNLTLIKEIRLQLPPLALQNQFAAVVEKVEALKEIYQKSLGELENLYGSLSQRAFRGDLGEGGEENDPLENNDRTSQLTEINLSEDIKVREEVKSSNDRKTQFTAQYLAKIIKDHYLGFHFNFEMIVNFLREHHNYSPEYYSSENLKNDPKLQESEDFKGIFFSWINSNDLDPFLKLEQVFYNANVPNFELKLKNEDFMLLQGRSKNNRSGIYFRIIP